MYLYRAKVGHHRIRFEVQTEHLKEWIAARFPEDRDELAALPVGSGETAVEAAGAASESEVVAALASTEAAGAKAVLYITDFYGSMYDEGPVEIEADGDTVVYSRKDYRMETSADYSSVKLQVFDDLALKHALINWYSAWLIHRREGLLVHSSCVVDGGKAWMFVGHSGAGKSTAAELSAPRPILSDEATLLLLDADGGVTIHDSPLRSENEERGEADACPLGGIHFLVQAEEVRREPVGKVEALIGLMDKVFYWKHSKPETAKMIAVCREVVQRVPAYELHFQKNDSFWEVIS
ncbi:hypothetical protein ACTHPH_12505 [Paenibacillus pasadenensis]|uniref:hypothetical protein n=1 Tax=Paenibacillus pasadenensis TaxID=217090 RepID=UPI0004207118|nr:hypothetical protein [Paenibacillus pasadenensis]